MTLKTPKKSTQLARIVHQPEIVQETRDIGQAVGWSPLQMSALMGGYDGGGVMAVSQSLALAIPAVRRCCDLISGNIGSTRLPVYKHLPNGGKIAVPTHPVQYALDCKGHVLTNRKKFWTSLVFNACLEGSGYAEIVWKKKGIISHLLLHDSRNVEVEENDQMQVRYFLKEQGKYLLPENVLHISLPGVDGLRGVSPLRANAVVLQNAYMTLAYYNNLLKNNAVPRGVVQSTDVKGKFDDVAYSNLRQFWNDVYGGVQNAGKIGILPYGMEFKPVGLNPVDAKVVEMINCSGGLIAEIWGVPKSLLFLDDPNESRASSEESNQQFISMCLVNWFEEIQNEICNKLFVNPKDQDYFVEYRVEQLLRGNMEARSTYFDLMSRRGVLSRNEWRAFEGLNPVDGGDVFYIESNNLSPIEGVAPPVEAEPDEPAPDPGADLFASVQPILFDQVGRLIRRGFKQLRKDATKESEFADHTRKALQPFLELSKRVNPTCDLDVMTAVVVEATKGCKREIEIGDEIQNAVSRILSTAGK
jgi:HK97 family phage portal protein